MADTKPKEDVQQWYLRINGESIFGPVTTSGLTLWAEQGRVLPGHEISQDRKKWIPAESVDFLGMRWFVDDGKCELRGPLNKKAAEALVASGKVPQGSQIVSSDEVETFNPSKVVQAKQAVTDEHQRMTELEGLVAALKEKLAKFTSQGDLESVAKERDAVAEQLKTSEAQREVLVRNAEKEGRAWERKLEASRQQVKKLEALVEEEKQSKEASADLIVEMNSQKEQATAAETELKTLRDKVGATEEALVAANQALEEAQNITSQTKADLIDKENELAALKNSIAQTVAQARAETAEEYKKKVEKEIADAQADESELEAVRLELDTAKKAWAESTYALKAASAAQQKAEAEVKASEQAYSELLTASNERDATYQKKIAGFEKLSSLTPDEIEKFYANRTAIYELVKAEVDELATSLEAERRYFEQIKKTSQQRLESMTEHRQELMLQLGSGPEDMTRRTLREQPTDPQNARLRAELENLKVTSQREEQFAATRDQELRQKLRLLESENAHLKEDASDVERLRFQLQDLQDQLTQRQKELEAERRKSVEAEKSFTETKSALIARIESLETKNGSSSTEAQKVPDSVGSKLATFMRLKR